MPDAASLSPLGHRDAIVAGEEATIGMREVAERAMLDLRIAEGDEETMAQVDAALGFALPRSPRTSAGTPGRAALWLSVDQWLITVPLTERAALAASLAAAVADRFAMITDMSDARAIIRLEGAGAREIVMKGAAADLTRPECVAGHVRRMLFAEISAMVHVVSANPDVLDLYVFRSYADYAWDWIVKAARPGASVRLFGPQSVPPV